MRRLKKAAAVFMASAMLVTMNTSFTWAAQEAEDTEMYTDSGVQAGLEEEEPSKDEAEEIKTEEKETTENQVGEAETKAAEEETAGTEESSGETQVLEAQGASIETEETAENAEATEIQEEDQQEAVLNYVYVDESQLSAPGEQNIAVGFLDKDMEVESAVLYGISMATEESVEIPASSLAGNAVLFTKSYEEGALDMITLTSMTYQAEGEEKTVDFQAEGIEAGYTVGETGAAVLSAEEENPGVSVYSFNDAGEEVAQEGSVEEIGDAVKSVLDNTDEPALARSARSGKKVIVICAGHDSTHTGAYGIGLQEEELTFKVAQYCKEALEKYPGVTVYLDRDTINCKYPGKSTSYCVKQRVKDAAALGATAFVDIHFNSGGGTGAEVYYPNKSWSQSIHKDGEALANEILDELSALGLYNRGAKIRNCTTGDKDKNGNLEDYYTTINLSKSLGMTGIIVEHAFLDNAQDASKLHSESFLKKLGEADALGIAEHYKLWEEPDYGPLGFEDVNQGDWYYDYVEYVKDKGIMTGMREGYFGAVEMIDRSQFVTTLYRMEGEPSVKGGKKFPDVPENMFFTKPVKWASQPGVEVATGYLNGKFGPQDKITREQMATMFYRYAEYKGYDTSISNKWKSYPDAKKVTDFAEKAMGWAVKNGMITGDQGKLNPQKPVSRAVAATLIQRFLEKYQ